MRAFLVATLLASCAWAEETTPRFVTFSLDNDWFVREDKHYSHGMQISFPVTAATRFTIGQRMYTPSNTDIPIPDPGDRPYAGWLYLTSDTRLPSRETIDHLTLSLGLIGPQARARETQRLFHHVLGNGISAGWDAQLPRTITAMAGFERIWPSVWSGTAAGRGYDVALCAGGVVGNVFAYADSCAIVRWGRNLGEGLPLRNTLGQTLDDPRGTGGAGWYLWSGIEGRYVARNDFLAGVRRIPFGYDAQAGVVMRWRHASFGFTLVERGREFEGQHGNDHFGQLSVSYAYR
jgi:hypothetical protein